MWWISLVGGRLLSQRKDKQRQAASGGLDGVELLRGIIFLAWGLLCVVGVVLWRLGVAFDFFQRMGAGPAADASASNHVDGDFGAAD